MPDDDDWMDVAVAPFRLLVDSLAVTAEPLVGPGLGPEEPGEGMYIESIDIALPFELDLMVEPGGAVRLAGAPPTQYTRTSVMPVFHRLAMQVRATKHDG